MKINAQTDPNGWRARAWLDGVEVGTADSPYRFCFEADDVDGYIKCYRPVEYAPGKFSPDEESEAEIHRGVVVIQPFERAS